MISRLVACGLSVTLELPQSGVCVQAASWPEGSLIVHRGVSRPILQQLAGLEGDGRTFCNGVADSLAALERPALLLRLASAGLPVPSHDHCDDWAEARGAAAARKVVVKAADGTIGRGSQVLFSDGNGLPAEPPFPGPYVVEDRVAHDGMDHKLYVAGSSCFGLLKSWPRISDAVAHPFEPSPDLRALALATGRAAGLEIYGVDVVIGPDGPVIVDVNVFPGFRGIPGAAEAVAGQVRRRAVEISRDG